MAIPVEGGGVEPVDDCQGVQQLKGSGQGLNIPTEQGNNEKKKKKKKCGFHF